MLQSAVMDGMVVVAEQMRPVYDKQHFVGTAMSQFDRFADQTLIAFHRLD